MLTGANVALCIVVIYLGSHGLHLVVSLVDEDSKNQSIMQLYIARHIMGFGNYCIIALLQFILFPMLSSTFNSELTSFKELS